MDFRVLGTLEVLEEQQRIALGGARQQALLAILVLHRRQVVSTDRLIDELWGESPPPSAAKTIQVYISHLRKALGDARIETHGRAYRLVTTSSEVDVDRFEALISTGRAQLDAGSSLDASESLAAGLALWRGPPLAEFAYEPFAQAEIARLREAHSGAREDRIEAELALGRHASLIGELSELVREEPLRERPQRMLMLALYRSGRHVEALELYQRASAALMIELGLEPSPALVALQQAILTHDPALDAPGRPPRAATGRSDRRVRRGGILIAAGGLVLLAAVAGALLSQSNGSTAIRSSPNSVAVIDPLTGRLIDDVPVGARPGDLAAGDGAIWVANRDDNSVSQIDPASRRVLSTTAPGTAVDGLAVDTHGLWVSDIRRSVSVRIDPAFRSVADTIRIAPSAPFLPAGGPVAVGAGAVWVGNGRASIIRIDPATSTVRARIDVGNNPVAIAVGQGGVWVADDDDNTVTRIDPASNAVIATVPVGQSPSGIAVGAGAVWVANTADDSISRIDPESGTVTATIPVGDRPTSVAVSDGAVWVANSLAGTVSRIDPVHSRVSATIHVGQSPESVIVADHRLWVSLETPPAVHAARRTDDRASLRVLLSQDPGSADPVRVFLNYQQAYATCALLLNYPDAPFPAGSRLQPEVAAAQPVVSAGGRTYTYTVRPGFAFSPPSRETVTAAAFQRAIERALSPKTRSFAATFMGDIVGARAYISGRTTRLAGVTATADRLVIHLLHAAPDFPARLATPWFCAVPPDTPISPSDTGVIPSAGPYYVASYSPGKSIVLRRNPSYHGTRPRRLAEIDYQIGVAPQRATSEVISGQADYYGNTVFGSAIAPAVQARLAERYGPQSPAAGAGHQQFFTEPQLSVYYLLFNTHRAPFNNVRLRQAVNNAIDRRSLAAVPFPGSTGRPADRYIPPGMPGFDTTPIYPLGAPDLAKARQLAGSMHHTVVLATCNLPACAQFAQIVHDNLAAIGITVVVQRLSVSRLLDAASSRGPHAFDLVQYNYAVDFPDPSDFINLQFESALSANQLFTDPGFDRRMRAAASTTGVARDDAYQQLDHDLVSRVAPAAAYASGTTVGLFSARIGCQLNQPIYGIDLGALCARR